MNKFCYLATAAFLVFMFSACQPSREPDVSAIAPSQSVVETGKSLFFYNCVACHNFERDGIGPHLAGITKQTSTDWLKAFIQDPKGVIDSGDDRASGVFARFNSYMPGFPHFSEAEQNALIAYIDTYRNTLVQTGEVDHEKLLDPVPGSIPESDIAIGLDFVFQIPPSSEQVPRTRITKLESHPNTGDLYMLDLNGLLYQIKNGRVKSYMNMAEQMPGFIRAPGLATGFGSFAFHPEFERNGLLYTAHSEPAGSAPADFSYDDSIPVTLQWVVQEWKTSTPEAVPFSGKPRELFRINMVVQYHGVQNLAFNPNAQPGDKDYGNLYIGIGDGGSVERGFEFLADGPTVPWGSIFRINPAGKNSRNEQYGIPENNPFHDKETVPEIYAHGFRNPHRFSWSKAANGKPGKMIAANIGHHNIESLVVVEPGLNYGWPYREGAFEIRPHGNMGNVYALPDDDARFNFTYPAAQYDHDEGNAICGGYVYQGQAIPELQGKYIFGDIVNGRVFYVETDKLRNGVNSPIYELQLSFEGEKTSLLTLSGEDRAQLRMGTDQAGEIYVFSKNDGKVYKFTTAEKPPE